MPHYFFHLSAPGAYSSDDVGIEYPHVEAAYLGAYQAALDISLELMRERTDPGRHAFEIMDQAGQLLFELPFSEVMHPLKGTVPLKALHTSIQAYQRRAKQAASELRESCENTRSLLAATKALLDRS